MKKAALGILAGLLLASCSSYQRDFRAAVRAYEPSPSPSGPWKGSWQSEVNGHHGPLWCLVRQNPDNPRLWDFRYRAGWGVLQFGDYTHRIEARPTPRGNLPVTGKMTLPNNFGTYTVKGLVTCDTKGAATGASSPSPDPKGPRSPTHSRPTSPWP